MRRQCYGALVGKPVQCGLRRKPVAPRLLVEVGRLLMEFAQCLAEYSELVAGLGCSKADRLAVDAGMWLADCGCRAEEDRAGDSSCRPRLRQAPRGVGLHSGRQRSVAVDLAVDHR